MAREFVLRDNGVVPTGVPSSGVAAPKLTSEELNALLGKTGPAPFIVPKYLGSKAPTSGRGMAVNATLSQDDQYGQALGREKTRIDGLIKAQGELWDKEWQAKYDKAQQDVNRMLAELQGFQAERARKVDEAIAWAQENGAPWKPRSYYEQVIGVSPQEENLGKAIWKAGSDIQVLTQSRDADRAKALETFAAPYQKNYDDAVALAQQLRDTSAQQSKFDLAYDDARKRYENAVTQFDKDRAAYDMYKAQKAQYDQDVLNRQADIDAGKYAVNPYAFIAQGASLNEIEELRKQVNEGNLRPNMRMPTELVAPTEVKDPGEFKETAPVHERVEAPKIENTAAADILGYKAPAPPKEDAPLKDISHAETDTSSVKAGYEAPEEGWQNKSAAEAAAPNDTKTDTGTKQQPAPQQPPAETGTGSLQQTSTSANTATQATSTTQTAPQAAEPAPALPEQTAGAVGGQADTTGQNKDETTGEKKEEPKPQPFTPDEDEKEKQDSVF